mgnify:CR=1 FL=1
MGKTIINIKLQYNNMGKAEKKIADFLLEQPKSILPLSIVDFAEVIHAVSKHLAELQEEGPVRLGIDDMIQCIVHLYDVGKDNPAIKTICLDAWDELFKNNLHDIKSLATILDNFS